jgi:hypothetical protein
LSTFQYTADILADALFRAGEATDGTSDYADQALSYLNNLYFQICRGGSELDPNMNEDWAWLRKPSPGVLILQPPVTTGTVSVTLGSVDATLTDAPIDYAGGSLSVANWFIKVSTHPDIFRVSTHTAGGTALTLDSVYTGTTDSAATYTLFLTDYDLASDVMRVIAPMTTYRNGGLNSRSDYKVYAAEWDTVTEQSPLALMETGIPDYFSPIGEVTQGVRRVRFNRCGGPQSTDVYRVDYDYLFMPDPLTSPGTTEEPRLPLKWRSLLSDFLVAYLHGIKNDDRATGAAQVAMLGLKGMAAENRYQMTTATKNAFRLKPRLTYNRARGRLRTESGLLIA